MAKVKLKLPKLGMSMDEATIAEWHVKTGDKVTVGQEIYAVETDKSTQDVECPFEGTLTVVAEVGQTCQIGEIVAEIELGA
ncbi:biotin/lipoyl-containing protein [Litorimonas haliclonae]|uniref:biotin/lipoyl-containing protein n=1 Tax=Litorimonas haliclonae TaxID=2081977 RepID=UPI0039F137F7